jgi:ribosomal protein S18 acetylase RimI-like enzyme
MNQPSNSSTDTHNWSARANIRSVELTDLPDMEWDGEYAHFRKVYAAAYERMHKGLSVLWVVEIPGSGIVGQVFIQLTCDRPELADGYVRAYLYSFRIKSEYQNAGLGSHVMDFVEHDLKSRGFKFITLNVAKVNVRAQNLYFKRGYRIVAHEPGRWSYPDADGVWHNMEEPSWRMEKAIAP